MRLLALVLVGLLAGVAVAGARTISGTPRDDRLAGTPRADVMQGFAGRDQLLGGSGADFLQGGPGRDVHDAGPGTDLIASSYDGARDIVRCGTGLDVVNADLPDTVASDCELVGRRLSRDPYRSDGAQHETEVEPDSFTFGRTTVATFQVGRRFDGAATNVGFAVTTNDGASWRSGLLPGLTVASRPAGANARASDPVVAYDAAHSTWLISTLALAGTTTRLAINRSPDGSTWGSALAALEERVAEGVAFDKNWLACDNTSSSPFFGRCYLVYTHSADRDMLAVSWSDDGGLAWSRSGRPRRARWSGRLPCDPRERRSRRRVPLAGRISSRSRPRARRTAARPGVGPRASHRSTGAAQSVTSARSRCLLRKST